MFLASERVGGRSVLCIGDTKRGTQACGVSKSLDTRCGLCQAVLQTAGQCAGTPNSVTASWAHPSHEATLIKLTTT